jgi:hypothetical protein
MKTPKLYFNRLVMTAFVITGLFFSSPWAFAAGKTDNDKPSTEEASEKKDSGSFVEKMKNRS